MKTRHPLAARTISLLSLGFTALAGFAGAQVAGDTYSYFYGQSGSTAAAGGAGAYDFVSAAPAGFSANHISHSTGTIYDGGAGLNDGTINLYSGPNSAGNNRISSIWSLGSGFGNNIGTGIDGSIETLSGVTLWINIYTIGNAANTPMTLGIYDLSGGSYSVGTGGEPLGNLVGSTQPLSTTGWVGIDIPLEVAMSGFILSALDGNTSGGPAAGNQAATIFSTHANSGVANTPGFSVSTMMVIPEPSSALLSGLAGLLLLRRRR